jgi:CP family cyanate transporter-like MFS transporter
VRRPVHLAVGLVLVVFSMRPPVAAVGPILPDLRLDLALSGSVAAALVAVPIVGYGGLAPAGPWLVGRVGVERGIFLCLGLIALGQVVRVTGSVTPLFAGTVALALGTAAANVLVPTWIKGSFHAGSGWGMGLYSSLLTVSSSIAAAVTLPIGTWTGAGWRGGLGLWAIPCCFALAVWLPRASRSRAAEVSHDVPWRTVVRHPTAWAVAVFFGLQALSFYAVLAWLPTLLREHGVNADEAGLLLAVEAAIQAPVALVVPVLVDRARSSAAWIVGAAVLVVAGLLGLITDGIPPLVSVIVLGVGQGASFALALNFFVVRAASALTTAALAAMAQSVGYLITATGPLLVGALRDLTGGWTVPIVVLAALTIPQAYAGGRAWAGSQIGQSAAHPAQPDPFA